MERFGLQTLLVGLLISASSLAQGATWRSALYPVDWSPGDKDAQGRFLHDYSHAGYHGGEVPIPESPPGITVDVTQSPYLADTTGGTDVTAAIQSALDDAGAAGGGVVYLPPGVYRVFAPDEPDSETGKIPNFALRIAHDGVVLRGAGVDATFILNGNPNMRARHIIAARPATTDLNISYAWMSNATDVRSVTADLISPALNVPLSDVSGYAPGDWIVVAADVTPQWLVEHGMTGVWDPATTQGPSVYRRIAAIDTFTNIITLDAPTRYDMLVRDNLRIHRPRPHLSEVGIEHLSIANVEASGAFGDEDFSVTGTGAYNVHASAAIHFNMVVNGWIRNVNTFRPTATHDPIGGGNDSHHILSNGIKVSWSRFVTIVDTLFQNPQYKGEGGNGYMYAISANDVALIETKAINARHSYSLAMMYSSGNVLYRASSRDARLPTDTHMFLTHANLFDNLDLHRDNIESIRRTCCGHGHSGSMNVMWNTLGHIYPQDWPWQWNIVESEQYGHGYVIGTRGDATIVKRPDSSDTQPRDWLEGVDQGDTLVPASLFEDQRHRRGLDVRGGTWTPPVQPDGGPLFDDGSAPDGGPHRDDGEQPDGDSDLPGGDLNHIAGDDFSFSDGGPVDETHADLDHTPSGVDSGCQTTDTSPGIIMIALGLLLIHRRRQATR